jgi:hypothetical protein
MRRTTAVWAWALAGLLATSAWAAERTVTNRHTGLIEAPLTGLRKAAEHGDRAELGRWGARIGVARLARALADSDRGLALAVLDSLPYLPARLLLLEPVLARCESADAAIGERALRTLGTILGEADAGLLEAWEVPRETSERACRVLAAVASRTDRDVTLRLAALQALADANALCAGRQRGSALLRDPSPEIRRAAVLLSSAADARAVQDSGKDPDASVVSASGAALCRLRLVPAVVSNSTAPAPRPLRDLAALPGTPAEDAAEMLVCLAESKDPADAKAAQEIRSKTPPTLRAMNKTP